MDSDSCFLDQFDSYFERIDEELAGTLRSRVPLVEDIGSHALLSKGKRLRPLFFVLCSRLCGYRSENVYRLSTIFEYVHVSSLLHDDVLDNAEMRRNKPSANNIWGDLSAVLTGDFLFAKAFSLAVSSDNLRFLHVLSETILRMTEGQILDSFHTHNWCISRDQYMEIITGKTAELISAACACGAIISGADDRAAGHLGQFGLKIGLAFQIVDDLLDYISFEEELGKPVGNDLREGKITLPLIYALSKLGEAESDRLENLFKNHKADEEDYLRLMDMVRHEEVVDVVRAEVEHFVQEAADHLRTFPESPHKDMLLELNRYIISRKH